MHATLPVANCVAADVTLPKRHFASDDATKSLQLTTTVLPPPTGAVLGRTALSDGTRSKSTARPAARRG